MRILSANITAEIAKDAVIPRALYYLEIIDKDTGDITTLRLTNHDSNLTFQGQTYVSYRIKHSPIKTYMKNQVDNCNITIDNVDQGISAYFAYNEFSGQKAEVYKVFLDSNGDIIDGHPTTDDKILQFTGLMDRPAIDEQTASIRIVNIFDRSQSYTPWKRYTPKCNWDFCGSRCTYNSSNGKARGVSTGNDDQGSPGTTLIDTSLGSFTTNYWKGGILKILSGTNKNEIRKISAYNTIAKKFTLDNPFSAAIGSTSRYIVECDKALSTCQGFSNYPHFGGFENTTVDINKKPIGRKIQRHRLLLSGDNVALVYGYATVPGTLLDAAVRAYTDFDINLNVSDIYKGDAIDISTNGRKTRVSILYGICAGEIEEIIGCNVNGKDIDITDPYGFAGRLGVTDQHYSVTDAPTWIDSDGDTQYSWILHDRKAGGPSDYYFPELAFACINSSSDSGYREGFPLNGLSRDVYLNEVDFRVKGLKTQEYDSAGDPTILQWSNNPAWCILDFLEKRSMRKLDSEFIDYVSFYNAAQVCIANNYEISLIIDKQENDIDTMTAMLTACRGYLTYTSGRIELNIEDVWQGAKAHSFDDASSGKSDDNISEKSFKYFQKDINDTPNRFIVKYTDQYIRVNMALVDGFLDKNVTTIPYDDLQGTFLTPGEDDAPNPSTIYIEGEAVTYTSKDDNNLFGCSVRVKDYPSGYPLFQGRQTFPEMTAIWNEYDNQDVTDRVIEKSISGLAIPTYRQAYNLAEWAGRKSVDGSLRATLQGHIDSLHLTVGDVVNLTHNLPGWVDAEFRVIDAAESEDEEVDYTLEIYDESIYIDNDRIPEFNIATTLPNPKEAPDHVTDLTVAENEYINISGTYIPTLSLTYTLPQESRFWDHAIIHIRTGEELEYRVYPTLGAARGAGMVIRGDDGRFEAGQEVYIKVISVNENGMSADALTAPTISKKIGGLVSDPAIPSGLKIEGGTSPVDYTWDGLRFAVIWKGGSQTGGAGSEPAGQEVQGAGGVAIDPFWKYDEVEIWIGGELRHTFQTTTLRFEYIYGDGLDAFLDAYMVAANGAVTIKVKRWNIYNKSSDHTEITLTQDAPADISGLTSDFNGRDLAVSWDANDATDFSHYLLTLNGNEKILTDPAYGYILDENRKDNTTADPSIAYDLKVYDIYGNASTATAGTFTNPVPATPTGLSATQWMESVQFQWTRTTEDDFSHYMHRHKIDAGSWGDWTSTQATSIFITAASGELVTIEVMMVDFFNQASSAGTVNGTAQGLDIESTDISDFAITASKTFTKIPIPEGDTWTDDSPSANYVAWNAHPLYYNGVKYDISADNTNKKYIYWVNGSAVYSSSDTNPALSDGDFMMATNIDGAHDLAWNAIANQVIGSAYIQSLAVQDAHIANCTVDKLTAGTITSKAITLAVSGGSGDVAIKAGKTDFGDNTAGFILGIDDSDSDRAKLEIGDASNYLKWTGLALNIAGAITITSGSGIGNLSDAGALAEEDTADFSTQVSGGAKPADNATANDTDANLKARTNHTGTQAMATVSDAGDLATKDTAGASDLDSTVISGGKIITGLLTADNIQAGAIRGINVNASSHTTKGSYITSALSGAETTVNVKDTTDFPSSGSGWFIDTTNDGDVFSWTGKTTTTLTGCSGALAHNNGATVVPQVKNMVIDSATNEMRFIGDRGDGTIQTLASIGVTTDAETADDVILYIGGNSVEDLPVLARAKGAVAKFISNIPDSPYSATTVEIENRAGGGTGLRVVVDNGLYSGSTVMAAVSISAGGNSPSTRNADGIRLDCSNGGMRHGIHMFG
ncbi:DUF2163 domain-containing protein, partial [Candidatus Pacearchaeota archaeon]|nr:DUF2163 domain-containing protein [Candidatus Pacearchaeota archaeon]